ncbi:MAG: radical SAM protein, partial [Cyanobacteria bacterium P01_F01_bin.42]
MSTYASGNRIIQIHPSRRCNLQCLHCYSSSSPTVDESLSVELLSSAIADAAFEGFEVVSFSGGEPLLFPALEHLMDQAHLHQMTNSMVTNGMLLTPRRLQSLIGKIDILAISLDGRPETHNLMRNQKNAFETMQKNLPALRESGIPFGFVFTLSQKSIKDFDWILEFAMEQGASLLQVHALEESGRAKSTLLGVSPNQELAAYTYLQVMRARKRVGDRIQIQLDLTHQSAIKAYPE